MYVWKGERLLRVKKSFCLVAVDFFFLLSFWLFVLFYK